MKLLLLLSLAAISVLTANPLLANEGTAQLAATKGCFVCHAVKSADSVGDAPLAPSYEEIAERYADHNVDRAEYLVDRLIQGTVGQAQNWADRTSMRFMPPNVNLSRNEASALVSWILTGKGTTQEAATLALATNSGCMTCHAMDVNPDPRLVPLAPAFRAIAARYADYPQAYAYLTDAIKAGTKPGVKNWHNANMRWMPPNPQLRDEDAKILAAWILGLDTTG